MLTKHGLLNQQQQPVTPAKTKADPVFADLQAAYDSCVKAVQVSPHLSIWSRLTDCVVNRISALLILISLRSISLRNRRKSLLEMT